MSQIADHEGTVSRAQLVKTRLKQADSEQSAINAYVVFVSVESARAALELNGKEIGGRHVRVDVASDAKKHDHTRSGKLVHSPAALVFASLCALDACVHTNAFFSVAVVVHRKKIKVVYLPTRAHYQTPTLRYYFMVSICGEPSSGCV